MILYLDTSTLVKPYAVEDGRDLVEQAVEESELAATSVVAYAEARTALARKCREGIFSAEEYREAVDAFDDDWETFEKPETTEDVPSAAGDLAEEHALRGFDAVHLASALLVRAAASERDDGEAKDPVLFLGFDSDLMKAARKVMRAYGPGKEDPNDEDQP